NAVDGLFLNQSLGKIRANFLAHGHHAPDVQTTLLLCAKVEVFIFGGGDGDASVFHFLDHGVDIIQFCLDASLVRSMQLQCRNTLDGSQVGPALRSAGDGNVV